MTREEDFRQVIQKAQEDARQEWLDGLPIAEWWENAVAAIVRPIFEDAVGALKAEGYDTASQIDKNGTGRGILLQGGDPVLNLEFKLTGETFGVNSSAPRCIKPVIWEDPRKQLTEETVGALVEKLLECIARQTVKKRLEK